MIPLPAGWTSEIADDYDLGLPFALWRARQAAVVRLLPVLRDRHLTEPQWRMLRMLQFRGTPQSQSDIARMCGFYVTHVKRTAGPLIARRALDWFKADETDFAPKRWKIGIARHGYELIAQVQAELAQRRFDSSGIFSAADRSTLYDLLLRYVRAVAWTPWQSDEAMFNPLHIYHDKHARHAQHAFRKWKIKDRARKEGRTLSPEEIQRALEDV